MRGKIVIRFWCEHRALASLGLSLIFLVGSIVFSAVSSQTYHGEVLARSTNLANIASMAVLPESSSNYSAVAQLPRDHSSLANSLDSWAKQQANSSWGVDITPISGTDVAATYNADIKSGTASVFKLYLVYAAEQTLPYDAWSNTKVGESKTYRECIEAMLMRSDNPCADAIVTKIGWSKLDKLVKAAGYNQTNLNTTPLSSTASDTSRFLADLYAGKLLSPEATKFVLGSMEHSIFRKGLVAGCPECQVINKTGDADGFRNDVGIIKVGDKTFALSVYSTNGTNKQIAALTKLITDYVKSH